MLRVVQIIDSLDSGGAEKMAVLIANALHEAGCRSHLCVTRQTGPLHATVKPEIEVLVLDRTRRLSPIKILSFALWMRERCIDVVHAHSSSVFFACAAALLYPVQIVLHDHEGNSEYIASRNAAPYRLILPLIGGVIAVNTLIVSWTRGSLPSSHIPLEYIRNFSVGSNMSNDVRLQLPGTKADRVVHLANFRPQKDHSTMIEAFARVLVDSNRPLFLLLVGEERQGDPYAEQIHSLVRHYGLEHNVRFMGRVDNPAIVLEKCAIGVLSSKSEGLPLALLEYGMHGCAAVCTDVGQCREVLADGAAGMLVQPGDAESLANAIASLAGNAESRQKFADELARRVRQTYSKEAAVRAILKVYARVMEC